MSLGAPSLYLDPLLPLALRVRPRAIPMVAGATPARAVLIVRSGGYRLSALRAGATPTPADTLEMRAPGLLWLSASAEYTLRAMRFQAYADGAPDDSARGELARSDGAAGGAAGGADGLLLVVGQRLLDQLIVGSFGEPGFSRFLEGFLNPGRSPSGPFLNDLEPLIRSLELELDTRPPAFRVRARSLLTDVMLSLYRAALIDEPGSDPDGFRMATVLDHIELNYDDHLDLASLAAMMGTSPTHLSRVFRREVGIPLFEYINRTRIRKACTLLRRTAYSVTRIAIDVGYNNVSFFNRYFRRIMRCSPREYRRSVEE